MKSWLALVLIGCVIYELTQSPALGSVLVCLKFGWDDFLTARWLWRRDGDRWRRLCLFWLYLAWGLWKTAIVAFFMSLAFALLARQAGPPAGLPQILRAFAGTFFLTLVTAGLSTLLTFLSVVCAWVGGVRLWLDSAVGRARRRDEWPPNARCAGRSNRLGTLVLSSMALGTLPAAVGVVVVTMPGGPAAHVLGFALTLLAPVTLVLGRELIAGRVLAHRPRECWPEGEEEGGSLLED
jgi:hypothetical protein